MREKMRSEKIGRRMVKIIDARLSLPTWLWALASAVTGLLVTYLTASNYEIIDKLIPVFGVTWGPCVLASSVAALVGMTIFHMPTVKWASFASFCLWIFGGILFYRTGGFANIAIYAGPMLVFWAYMFMAAYIRDKDGL